MLGIGKAHQNDPNGLAWKQNKDFESLLRRLNGGSMESAEERGTKLEGFARAGPSSGLADAEESKKRKREEVDEGEDRAGVFEAVSESKEKKSKKDKKKKKAKEGKGVEHRR